MAGALYIGLMSGTSVDGIDAALLRITPDSMHLVASHAAALPAELRSRLLTLTEIARIEPEEIGRADRELGLHFAGAALALLRAAGIEGNEVRAIGSHGQTIRHRPGRGADGALPFTWQIGDPHTIAERTGICTVADFRRRDVAAGGQGAPLVPAFHAAAFGSATVDRVIVNIGGFANLSMLPAGRPQATSGFDTGPGNALMDAWIRRHQGLQHDAGGGWARSGQRDDALLARLLSHAFFALAAPKSTGREEFNLAWLDRELAEIAALRPQDVQATLLELTVRSIAAAIDAALPAAREIYVCGGGAWNDFLMERLGAVLAPRRVATTAALGIDPDWVEASAFAWLAHQALEGLPGNVPAVTGASGTRVLGAIHPA